MYLMVCNDHPGHSHILNMCTWGHKPRDCDYQHIQLRVGYSAQEHNWDTQLGVNRSAVDYSPLSFPLFSKGVLNMGAKYHSPLCSPSLFPLLQMEMSGFATCQIACGSSLLPLDHAIA